MIMATLASDQRRALAWSNGIIRPMKSSFDLSFLTDEFVDAQQRHAAAARQLLEGDQPDHVVAFEYEPMCVPPAGPFDRDQWLTQQIEHIRQNFDRYCDPVTWRQPVLSLSRYGLHFFGAVLGCTVRHVDDQVWCEPLTEAGGRLEDFARPNLDDSPVLTEAIDLLRFVIDATEGRVPIEAPFCSEPLMAAVDLFGDQFLMALAQEPEPADRVLGDIAATIIELRDRLANAAGNAPINDHHAAGSGVVSGFNLLYGCTTHLVSAQTYRDHVLALDTELLNHQSSGGVIHLCGRHLQHLEAWRDTPGLRAVQLNNAACDDTEAYWRGLRPDQFIVFWPDDAVTLDQAIAITGGRRLAVRCAVAEPIPVQ